MFQTLALADHLDVPDNLFLGREKIRFNLGPFSILDYKGMREATIAGLKKTGVKIPNIHNTIQNMSGGQRQCVAIARTATFHSKLTIMDEPTAALGVQETAQVENIIRTLKEQGEPLILISHNMRQVMDLCDRIVVWRRGPHLRQPPQGGDRRPGRRRLHHRRQDPGRVRLRGVTPTARLCRAASSCPSAGPSATRDRSSPAMKIALDPFMHRHLSLEALPSKVAELGYEWIELAPAPTSSNGSRRRASSPTGSRRSRRR